ncbi:hypothetical protein REPUB_Repub15cG0115500 [Reevesia pubescens]
MLDFPLKFGPIFTEAISQLCDPLFQCFQTHPSPPVAIISDMLLSSWVNSFASELNIRNLNFIVLNANSTLSLTQKGLKKLLSRMRSWGIESFARNALLPCMRSWGIVFNKFLEVDGDKMEIIKEEFTIKHDRMWAIGPLPPLQANNKALIERGGPSSMPGDQISLTKPQTEAVALALEESGVRLGCQGSNERKLKWHDHQNLVPFGFEERVAGRGLVIKGWTPQLAILEHRAVGSYLTHCGWNSALEAILGGVLLLAWSMQVDHFDNTNV